VDAEAVVAVRPSTAYALTEKVCEPFGTFVVSKKPGVSPYGAVVSLSTTCESRRKSTRATLLLEMLGVAVHGIVPARLDHVGRDSETVNVGGEGGGGGGAVVF
jgi:hypothetical protein